MAAEAVITFPEAHKDAEEDNKSHWVCTLAVRWKISPRVTAGLQARERNASQWWPLCFYTA